MRLSFAACRSEGNFSPNFVALPVVEWVKLDVGRRGGREWRQRVSGFGRILLCGAVTATVVGIVSLRAQTQLADPKDAPRIFASTCSACHKSPQGLAKSGQVAGFLRQHYTTGPEMSAAMAAYLVAAGSAPAKKDKSAAAEAKTKGKKGEPVQAQPERAAEAKEHRTLRGKQMQQQAKEHAKREEQQHQPAPTPAAQPPAEPPTRQAAAPAALIAPAPAPEPAAPPVTLDIPLPEMPTGPPADLTQSVFSSAPLP
jgi:hypothetical protein